MPDKVVHDCGFHRQRRSQKVVNPKFTRKRYQDEELHPDPDSAHGIELEPAV